jgi:hypothetical protein
MPVRKCQRVSFSFHSRVHSLVDETLSRCEPYAHKLRKRPLLCEQPHQLSRLRVGFRRNATAASYQMFRLASSGRRRQGGVLMLAPRTRFPFFTRRRYSAREPARNVKAKYAVRKKSLIKLVASFPGSICHILIAFNCSIVLSQNCCSGSRE